MCGIAGAVGVPLDIAEPAVERIRLAMAHRGPDDHGVATLRGKEGAPSVVFAHNRLSIIDLSAAGHEPMFSGGGAFALTFNGEVYNFRELRVELQQKGAVFASDTDAEVVLAAYQAWGPNCVQHFRGMFALALADCARRTVWLCRDRLGIKPLYLTRPPGGGLLFASEVRGLLAAGPELVRRRASREAIESYLMQGAVCGFESSIAGIHLIPPATSLLLDWTGREVARERYWSLSFPTAAEERTADRPGAVRDLAESLREAMRLHLISDVPLGIFLSSGVDSAALATVASELLPGRIHTLSVGFDQPKFDETAEAAELAQQLGTEHTELRLSGEDLLEDIDKVFGAMDQPTVDGFNTFVVSRAARRAGLTVAISGLGGDELFGGYASFRDVPRATALRGKIPFTLRLPPLAQDLLGRVGGRPAVKALELLSRPPAALESYLLRRELLLDEDRRALGARGTAALAWSVEGLSLLSERNQVSALELGGYMRDMLLRDGDVFSMAVGLELRVPFLDHVLVEKVARLPGHWKAPDPRPKPLLVDAVGGALHPSVSARPKRGFTFPWDAWLHGPMRERAARALDDQDLWRAAEFVPEAPGLLWKRFQSGDGRVGGLQVLALWVLHDYLQRHDLRA
jgi:asparagine synthase (glutamine-hydrolysing)